jgi:RND family efflux transporter MFP subunit
LLKENSVSQQEFEEIESRHLQAQAGVAQTRAMLDAARSRIHQAEAGVREAAIASKDARVRAPYAGQIVRRTIEVGDLAAPGTPFFIIEQEGLYCADLVLPERHIQEIKIGQEMRVVISALADLEVIGQVGRIVPSADAGSRSFEIKVALPQGMAGLKSGMFARVFVPIGGTGLLLVPQAALVYEGQLTGLYVVDDDQIARFRLVRLGQSIGDQQVVISGLAPGQRYVSDVPPQLRGGVRVETNR